MAASPRLEHVLPEVLAFESDGFHLGNDLRHLASVRCIEAPEAAIFYAARILEALSGAALERIGATPSANAFANLQYLESLNLLAGPMRYWAHGLRRLGNEVRHIHRLIPSGEDEVAALYLERWLSWFFLDFKRGPKCARLTLEDRAVLPGHDGAYMELIAKVEAGSQPAGEAAKSLDPLLLERLVRAPSIACAWIEDMIGRKHLQEAEVLLQDVISRTSDTLRLVQLQAVIHNRRADEAEKARKKDVALAETEKSIALLTPLAGSAGGGESTAGVLGGAWKRKANLLSDKQALEKSFKLYRDGFRQLKQQSAYLGVNVASVALLLGRAEEARETAQIVVTLLREREKVRLGLGADAPPADYWDAVSLAEAQLLTGDVAGAMAAYAAALAGYKDRRSDINSSQVQARRILQVLGGNPENYPEVFAV